MEKKNVVDVEYCWGVVKARHHPRRNLHNEQDRKGQNNTDEEVRISKNRERMWRWRDRTGMI